MGEVSLYEGNWEVYWSFHLIQVDLEMNNNVRARLSARGNGPVRVWVKEEVLMENVVGRVEL